MKTLINKSTLIFLVLLLALGSFLFLRSIPLRMSSRPLKVTYDVAIKMQDFANQHNHLFFHKRYKAEIEEYISSAVPKAEKEMDEIVLEAEKYCNDYKNNPDKEKLKEEFENKLYDYERSLDSPDFWLYVGLSEIQDKYLLIPFGGLPTDWSGSYADILLPYFNKYKIDYSGLIAFGKYYNKKLEELRKLHNMNN